MTALMTYGRFLLYPGEVLRLDTRQTVSVRCEQGQLWVTATQPGIDQALAAGEAASGRGRVLVESAAPSTLLLVPVAADAAEVGLKLLFPSSIHST